MLLQKSNVLYNSTGSKISVNFTHTNIEILTALVVVSGKSVVNALHY